MKSHLNLHLQRAFLNHVFIYKLPGCGDFRCHESRVATPICLPGDERQGKAVEATTKIRNDKPWKRLVLGYEEVI